MSTAGRINKSGQRFVPKRKPTAPPPPRSHREGSVASSTAGPTPKAAHAALPLLDEDAHGDDETGPSAPAASSSSPDQQHRSPRTSARRTLQKSAPFAPSDPTSSAFAATSSPSSSFAFTPSNPSASSLFAGPSTSVSSTQATSFAPSQPTQAHKQPHKSPTSRTAGGTALFPRSPEQRPAASSALSPSSSARGATAFSVSAQPPVSSSSPVRQADQVRDRTASPPPPASSGKGRGAAVTKGKGKEKEKAPPSPGKGRAKGKEKEQEKDAAPRSSPKRGEKRTLAVVARVDAEPNAGGDAEEAGGPAQKKQKGRAAAPAKAAAPSSPKGEGKGKERAAEPEDDEGEQAEPEDRAEGEMPPPATAKKGRAPRAAAAAKKGASVAEAAGDDGMAAPAPAPKKRAPRGKKAAAAADAESEEGNAPAPTPAREKNTRAAKTSSAAKRAATAAVSDDEAAEEHAAAEAQADAEEADDGSEIDEYDKVKPAKRRPIKRARKGKAKVDNFLFGPASDDEDGVDGGAGLAGEVEDGVEGEGDDPSQYLDARRLGGAKHYHTKALPSVDASETTMAALAAVRPAFSIGRPSERTLFFEQRQFEKRKTAHERRREKRERMKRRARGELSEEEEPEQEQQEQQEEKGEARREMSATPAAQGAAIDVFGLQAMEEDDDGPVAGPSGAGTAFGDNDDAATTAAGDGEEGDEDNDGFVETQYAPQMRIIDGQLVIDESSLQIDRGPAEDLGPREIVEESMHDRFVNSNSYSKRRIAGRWNKEETERFFDAVSQFGTDFEMIAALFPLRRRREIVNKFNKEDRKNPAFITQLIYKRKRVDVEAYAKATGQDLSGPVPEDPMEAINRRRAELEASGGVDPAGADAAGGRKRKGKKKEEDEGGAEISGRRRKGGRGAQGGAGAGGEAVMGGGEGAEDEDDAELRRMQEEMEEEERQRRIEEFEAAQAAAAGA
ncbi:hypothetical protein Rhopal_002513-T1 [Rhodotorula paludigena]|uniref:Myb-like domain-containing protein n=1 Tax=Rhodotorula paludigena TaxID=86838 RepID=A0AAV5GAS5_9BASI|nr:hypothetical protein Rhopal_002513-T1 [Rhodotorula paludigena]